MNMQSFATLRFPSLISKPAYLTIAEYAPTKLVTVLIPSRTQYRLNVNNLLIHCAEATDKQDKRIVHCLFESGAVQVLLASKGTAWSIPVACYMVIIMGVQYYEGKDRRCVRSMLPTKPAPYSSFLAPSPTSTSEAARIGSYNDKLPE
ncbi:hypothetical protein EDD85DRAFT_555868 [Armillaria nabsnona]|nr:hypothetical protein EDD85DRAFT_555868 [Armillaria nabsnona]